MAARGAERPRLLDRVSVVARDASSSKKSSRIRDVLAVTSGQYLALREGCRRAVDHRYLMALSGFGLVANPLLAAPTSSPPFAFAATGAASVNQNIAVTKDAMDRIFF